MSCKILKFCWIPILLFFSNSYSFAQKNSQAVTDSAIASPEEDSVNSFENVTDTLIVKTVFDNADDSILKWKQSRDFGYIAYLDSLLKKRKDLRIDTVSIDESTIYKSRRTKDSETGANSNSFFDGVAANFFFWTLAVFFIGFILYKLFFTGALFAGKNARVDDEAANKEPEFLNEYSAYNALIQEAESKNNFNLSVRYLYLQSLKKLADSELIIFSADKANNLYVQELAGRSYQQEFAFLTLNYEYLWYGRFTIDITRYQKLKEEFILFNKKV